jgi:hypothetical protein
MKSKTDDITITPELAKELKDKKRRLKLIRDLEKIIDILKVIEDE